MKKLLMNREPVKGPWGGGNLFVKAICEHAEEFGWKIVHGFEPGIDAILMVDPRPDGLGIGMKEIYQYRQVTGCRVVHRVNENDARKGTNSMDEMLRACSHFTDASVFVSKWIQDYHKKKGWYGRKGYVVYNGVDHDHFKPAQKFNDGKTHLVTHHWSNNLMKGFDIYDKLDEWIRENDAFTFTYIGRDHGNFKNTRVVSPLFGQELGAELGRYDIYISASLFDPGPNHIIEALACGIPTYAIRDGGGACEFVGVDGVYEDYDDLVRRLTSDTTGPILGWNIDWKECARLYFEVFKEVL